jgi:hypothetical protein
MRCGQSGGKKQLAALKIQFYGRKAAFHLLYTGKMGIFLSKRLGIWAA